MQLTRAGLTAALTCVVSLVSGAAGAREHVWIEGESATSHTFNKHSWYSSTDIRKDLLSPGVPGGAGGDWLAHFSNSGAAARADYSFSVSEGGEYSLWLRCNPFRAAHSYSLDGGAATAIDLASDPRERLNLIAPKIDMRFIAWIKLGPLKLSAGAHKLTLTVSKDSSSGSAQSHAGIDALVLINYPWAPSGASKPRASGVTPGKGDWFPLHVDDDPLSPASITDMRRLLQRPAGKYGAPRREGDAIKLKNGSSIKFFGVNASMASTKQLRVQQARLYAKHGVNLVRQHPVQAAIGLLQGSGTSRGFDAKKLDAFDHWFATLRAEGIYMAWSPFYPHVITAADGYPADLYNELPASGGGKSSSGMVNFMTALQDAQWQWLKVLLEHKNPYTNKRYVDDPALAIVETHNEDSVFWHAPLNDLATGSKYPKHTAALKKLWMEWVKVTYKTDAALAAAWGAGKRSSDSVSASAMAIYGAWQMAATGPANTAEKQRMGDFIRFLAETQARFYRQRQSRLRALGFSGLTVTTAWKAGGAAADAANLWADDVADVIDRHNYFGGGEGGHNIKAGKVLNHSHLSLPGRGLLSIGLYQVEDRPFVISEWTQKPPNQWKAEALPLMVLYGMGLQGWDGLMHFSASRVRMGSGWPGLRSYVSETPHYLGQFPALALAVAKGHIKQGQLVFARRLPLKAVFGGVDALKQDFTESGYDNKEPKANPETPVEVLAIGRVTAKIKDGQAPPLKADWSKYWDKTNKVVTSSTGELVWDYARKLLLIKSPRTQGVVGFAGGQTITLPDVTVKVDTPFVSLLLTSLDDQPLGQSSQILITALAQDRQTGAAYNTDGTQLLKEGGPPLLLQPVQATLTFSGSSVTSAKKVDLYGVPTATDVQRNGNTITIDGRYATYYYEIKTSAVPPPDSGSRGDSGGSPGDLGGDNGVSGDGCGCHLSRPPGPWPAGVLLWGLTLGLLLTRRRRRG